MNIVTLDHITKNYTGKKVLADASFYLEEGEKVGIIGQNGCGKSTLLRILARVEEPDDGQVIMAANKTVAMLTQHPEFEENQTVLEAAYSLVQKQKEADAKIQAQAKSMLTKLGIFDFDMPVENLSGGQKKKVALVAALLLESDILLLDEPTNHLDGEMSEWLEEYLVSFKKTLVLITHDRYFLDSVVNRIVEIDHGSTYSYQENYSGFLERKAERLESMAAADRKRKSLLRNELKWVQRGARARTTKQKARLQRFEQLKDIKPMALEEQLMLSSLSSRMGKTTVELEGICKAYGDKVLLKDFTYTFLKHDRVGFVGRNGCGKTTLMKMIATAASKDTLLCEDALVYPDSGTIVIGQTIKVGYYSQEIGTMKQTGLSYMDPDLRVIDYIKQTAEFVDTVDGKMSASKMCERFLFDSEQQYSLIGKLSGGQKRRLQLLRILMESPNVLILDEPTNDLDIDTLTILEAYLDQFDGIVIAVSHDRYFLDRCIHRIFAFEEGGYIAQYEGGFTDYQTKRYMDMRESFGDTSSGLAKGNNSDISSTNAQESESSEQRKPSHARKLTFKEQKEYDTIEEDIARLEEEIEQTEAEIIKASRDFVKLNELTQKKEALTLQLSDKMERWVFLEELVESISKA